MGQCKETKSFYDEIDDFFKFINDASKKRIEYKGKTYRINCSFPADQSCHWKLLGMGGSCKNATHFCHLCSCESSNCASFKMGRLRCSECVRDNVEKCFHHTMDTDSEIERKKKKCEKLEEKYNYFEHLLDDGSWKYFVMKVDPNILNKENLPLHIDYKPPNRQAKLDFNPTINQELSNRNLAREGRLEVRQARLKEALLDQSDYLYMKKAILRYERTKSERKVKVEWCVTCIMHMHNRVTEKILYQILKEGYALRATRELKHAYIKAIQDTLNKNVFESENSPTNWQVPLTENKNDISSKLLLTDGRSKQLMKNVDVVLNITFNTFDDTNPTEWTEKYRKWDNVISLFNEVNEMVQSCVVFTDEMILNFQKKN